MEEPLGAPEAWREREGREFFSSDAVTPISAKDVTTTERSGNASALLPIMILLSEALPNGMLSMLELARACLAVFMQGITLLLSSHQTAYPIERDCERVVYPLAVERRGRGRC